MSQSNAQKIFAKLGYSELDTSNRDRCTFSNVGAELLKKLQTAEENPQNPNISYNQYSGPGFVEFFKNDVTNQPLSQTISPENETKSSLGDEIADVWNHICVVGMKDIIKDRKFMRGKCFDCSNAAATYLLYPCYHLNRCDACFRKGNINNDIKCLLCGKRSNGFLDVMTGKTQ